MYSPKPPALTSAAMMATPIVMTDSVKDRLDAGFELIAFGEQPVRGHSALRVWGIAGIPAGASEAALR